MDVLLDTCCVIWAASDPDRLSARAREILASEDTLAFVSPASCAELACLWERDRVRLDRHWKAWFNAAVDLNAWNVEVIDLELVQEAGSLPGEFHADPADRILVATARVRGYTILTGDRRILEYPHVRSLW